MASCIYMFVSFTKFKTFFNHDFLKYFSLSLLDSDDINTVFLVFIPEVSEIIFFSVYFLSLFKFMIFYCSGIHQFHSDVIVNIFNPTIQKAEARGSL